MQRQPDTWVADPNPAYSPTIWRHNILHVQWHPALILTAVCLWACVGYLFTGHTKSELLAPGLSGFIATAALALGGVVSFAQGVSLCLFLVPKSWRKTAPSIGLVELPSLLGFILLLLLLNP